MNPPSANVFLSSAELVICLTPSFPCKQSLQNRFATSQHSSQNPPCTPATLPSGSLCHCINLFSKHYASAVNNSLKKHWANVISTKTGINQCFSIQQGLWLFSKKLKHTVDCLINLLACGIPTPARSFCFYSGTGHVP